MRIVEPSGIKVDKKLHAESKSQKIKKLKFLLSIILAALVLYGIKIAVFQNVEESSNAQPGVSDTQSSTQIAEEDTAAPGELRKFSGNEFRLLYDQLLQPNLDKVDIPPYITGNEIADTRIRKIAETRGYKLRSSPLVSLNTKNGITLQPDAFENWLGMQMEARSEGINMTVVSSYRSVDEQRSIFISRLSAEGVTTAEVADGVADTEVDKVLVKSSIPGYSKHHTGYTIDLLCSGYAFDNFINSNCFDWLSVNNYKHAKKFGFIPSYPPDADLQGPDPEAWEYVYVGVDLLTYQ